MPRSPYQDEHYGTDLPPGDVPAPRSVPALSHDYQFALDIQKSIGELGAKVDRVIKDNEEHGRKLDEVRHQVSFVKGAIYVVGILAALVAFLIANKVHISFGDIATVPHPSVSAPAEH